LRDGEERLQIKERGEGGCMGTRCDSGKGNGRETRVPPLRYTLRGKLVKEELNWTVVNPLQILFGVCVCVK